MVNVTQRRYYTRAKTLFSWLLILLPVGILVYAFATQGNHRQTYKAVNGQLDLSHWNPDEDGTLQLDGAWTFYWNRLLSPSQLDSSVPASATLPIPGIWNGQVINGQKLPGRGYGTFVLDTKLPASGGMYALKLFTMSNAYSLWVNDSLLAKNGQVGTDAASTVPEYRPQIVTFTPQGKHVRFVVQVSNFYHWKGGFWHSIKLGRFQQILQEHSFKLVLELFLFGGLFMMALYHFVLFFLRRKDLSTIYFGLMCAVICTRSLFTGENLIQLLVPGLDWFIARRMEYLLTFVTTPLYIGFMRSLYPQELNRWVYNITVGVGMALFVFVLLTPVHIYTFTSYIFSAFASLAALYAIYVFVRAAWRKREGSGLLLATTLFFIFTIVNDVLNQTEIIHTGLYLPVGLLVVVFAQAYILSLRSANAYRSLEVYADTLRKFIPKQFLNRIAKDGIESIKVGNAEKGEVTVIFSDIRSFTSLSESMPPDEIFNLLNQYLSYVEPPIRNHHGFVDKYMGDGVMALFEKEDHSNSANNALLAALAMQTALKEYNVLRIKEGKAALEAGTGIHSGQVVIGTIGANERIDSTAIGDAVNLASRIEEMTKVYGTPILASEATIELLDNRHEFVMRFVDKAKAKGKTEPIGIWEIMGRISEMPHEFVTEVLPRFEEAMLQYRHGKMQEARELFGMYLSLYPNDRVAQIYRVRCEEILDKPLA